MSSWNSKSLKANKLTAGFTWLVGGQGWLCQADCGILNVGAWDYIPEVIWRPVWWPDLDPGYVSHSPQKDAFNERSKMKFGKTRFNECSGPGKYGFI